MRSIIHEGTIAHHRYRPVSHDLSYPVYFYAFDLDDLAGLNRRFPLFGLNRTAVTSIWDKDYLQPGNIPIKQKVLGLLEAHQVDRPVASVIMVTSARYFNYIFNPVSFFYCFSRDRELAAVVAEVRNTYGERHPYVLTSQRENANGWFAVFQTPKVFHVSPFNKIEGMYHFYFSEPGNRLEIRIELIHNQNKIMAAVLKAEGRPLTRTTHLKTILKYPVAPHLNIPRIYAHAFKLFFQKKLAFNDKPVPRSTMTLKKQAPGMVESICKRLVFTAFKKITTGCLKVELPDQTRVHFGNINDSRTAVIRIRDYHFFSRVILDGEIGFGEAYMAQEWDSPDLVALLTLLIMNRDRFSDGNLMLSFFTRIQEKLSHDKRRNTISKTPENIRAHYDVSNDFYALFLDRRMLYSCALFEDPSDSLEAAQVRKMERILAQADIRGHHHLLEIGCGWGGFAVFAARQTGCRVTGITVSKAQYDKACRRVKDEGLEDRITILLQDYRHTEGTFDRIVSIEMVEAVGPQFLAAYFRQCRHLIKPGGKMVFQAIIIEDGRYERYCRERDWIQKHIFPGGHLPCLKLLKETISAHTDFKIEDVYHMAPHYAATLAHWRERFTAGEKKVAGLGFDETFCRKWTYYFSICEAGFTAGGIDDIQVTLTA